MYVLGVAKSADQKPLVGKPCTIVQEVGNHYLIYCEGKALYVDKDQVMDRDVFAKKAAEPSPKRAVTSEASLSENEPAPTSSTTPTSNEPKLKKTK